MNFFRVAGMLACLTAPAVAGVNLEFGEEYETVYLAACTQEHSARACQCTMEALEERVGFMVFADQVDRYRDSLVERSDLGDLASDLLARCTALVKAD